MIFKKFQDIELSALGMGCMRLPVKENKEIDTEATAEMVEYAMAHGINYYDTAWGYHGGKSETVMGEILSKYPRESYCLASKFPGYDLNNMGKAEEIFEKQLKKCKTEYFDFYLFHNVCELNIDAYLDRTNGVYDYLIEQKKNGRIRHLGFSVHGTIETTKRFLDAYGKDMEFCQIQLNWLDWNFQNAKAKVELLGKWNIPVWVMEPVRGGSLCRLHPVYAEKLRASVRPDCTQAEVAFRYIQSIPSVTVTLSGMSDFAQLRENIATFEEEKPLGAEEVAALYALAEEMVRPKTLPCTACRYCTEYCPMELDIPRIIEIYNEHNFSDGGFIAPMALRALKKDGENKTPSSCIGCRSCESVCPQNIKISEMMAEFAAKIR
ncbi:MAG: aldo/keto reductase [Clostridia bacterium]|nr:aldo/keto reductase [Clostridia bacterium]